MLDSFAFIQLKSFGDLVVVAESLKLLTPSDLTRCKLVIGQHLKDLCEVLAPQCTVEILPIPGNDVPALFDIKKRGVVAGFHSAWRLRTAIASAAPGMTLVVERQNLRERFISGGRRCVAIPRKDNVYLAFEAFTSAFFRVSATEPGRAGIRGSRVALCPFSRVSVKNLPPGLIVELAQLCEQAGFEPELLLLEGEHVQHPGLPLTRVIPRRFDALSKALAGYCAVVSADSLPAHLAEYGGTATFVVSPVVNRYWLPKRSFLQDHWALINERADLMIRLRHFLDTARP